MLQTLFETPVATAQYALNIPEQLKLEPQTLLSSGHMGYTSSQPKNLDQANFRQNLDSL